MSGTYLPRPFGDRVLESLADTPAVCLLGPRQVGKTTLAQHVETARRYLTLDDPPLMQVARQAPLRFADSLPERATLDEVHRAPRGGRATLTSPRESSGCLERRDV